MKAFLWFIFCVVLYVAAYYISCNTAAPERFSWCFVQWAAAFFGGGIVVYEILAAQGMIRD